MSDAPTPSTAGAIVATPPPAPPAPSDGAPPSPPGGPEASPTPEPKSPPPEAFAKLAKTEARLRAERDAFKRERETFEKELAPLREAAKLISEGKRLEALERLGVRYEDVTKDALGRKKPDPGRDALAELEKLKADLAAKDEAANRARVDAQLTEWRSQIHRAIHAEPDRYEAIITAGAEREVENLIRRHFDDTYAETGEGVVLSEAEAADIIEERLLVRAQKLAAMKKLAPKASTPPPELKPEDAPPKPDTHRAEANADGPRTLSTRHAASVASRSSPGRNVRAKDRAERELLERAAAKLGGK